MINVVSFNLSSRTVPVPPWLRDLTLNKLGPLIMLHLCISTLPEKGSCNPTALCEGVFGAAIRKKIEDEQKEQEEIRMLSEFQNTLFEEPLDNYERYNLDISSDSSILNHPAFSVVTPEPYDSIRSVKLLPKAELSELLIANRFDVGNIKTLVEKVNRDIDSESTADFWRCLSQTMDRFFLVLFVLVYIVVSIGLFLCIPPESL